VLRKKGGKTQTPFADPLWKRKKTLHSMFSSQREKGGEKEKESVYPGGEEKHMKQQWGKNWKRSIFLLYKKTPLPVCLFAGRNRKKMPRLHRSEERENCDANYERSEGGEKEKEKKPPPPDGIGQRERKKALVDARYRGSRKGIPSSYHDAKGALRQLTRKR